MTPALVWFRHDLRLSDNPALAAAVEYGGPVIPAYIWSPDEEAAWPPGAASKWWLNRSLAALGAELEKRGLRLIIRRGPTAETLNDLLSATGATAVFWNRRYESAAVSRDSKLKSNLRKRGITAESFNASLLFEPQAIKNGSGNSFRVFTPFWRACLAQPPISAPLGNAPRRLRSPGNWPTSLHLAELELEPTLDWADGLQESWQPGEAGAHEMLNGFCEKAIDDYPTGRDKPARIGTSRLSPHLHFGEISARQIWHEVMANGKPAREAYLRQLGWREFAHHLLYHHPHSTDPTPTPGVCKIPWRNDPRSLRAWQLGQTGYPLVDAGMRELWHTGWMHNRVRMVVASFLVKHLLIEWQAGAAWFWDTLVDADSANNSLGWQWVSGCGADAAPYFRIFSPIIQAEKFDAAGQYVRRWVPEIAALPDEFLHKPWKAPDSVLRQAGVELGRTYPQPIIDHATARARALAALSTISESRIDL